VSCAATISANAIQLRLIEHSAARRHVSAEAAAPRWIGAHAERFRALFERHGGRAANPPETSRDRS
jgi:hypothetical protein